MSSWRIACGVGALIVWTSACRNATPPPSRTSVVLITVDTLRPDRLSCYGYQAQQTPGIDALARDGVLFEHAVCDVPWTTGSMASVFTGQYASRHQLRMSTERLPDSAVTLAEVLHDNGYATGAVVGSFPLASIYNLNQGFDQYDEDFSKPMEPLAPGQPATGWDGKPRKIKKIAPRLDGSTDEMQHYFVTKAMNDACRPDSEVTERAIAWLHKHAHKDFFLWAHYFGPHERITFLRTWEQQAPRVIAEYDRDLSETDSQVARLLAAIDGMGLHDRTLIVLHADHGQSLGENAYVGHGDNLYPATLRIPLLMRWPGHILGGRRVSPLALNVDLFPTILGLLGLKTDLPLNGADLAGSLMSPPAVGGEPRVAYAETFLSTFEPHPVKTAQYGPLSVRLARFGVLRDERMYVRNEFLPPCTRDSGEALPDEQCRQLWTEELFDAFQDPHAVRDLKATESAALPEWRSRLAANRQASIGHAEPVTLSPADREKLRALGYDH